MMVRKIKLLVSKYFSKLSITNKFFVSLIIVLILPLTALFIWMNINLSRQIYEQNIQINLEVLKQTKSPINYLIEDIEFVSLEVLGNENLQQYINQRDLLSSKEAERLQIEIDYEINNLISSRESISRMSVFVDEGILFQFGNHLIEEAQLPYDDIIDLKGKQMWLPAYFEQDYISGHNHDYEVTAVRAINNIDVINNIIGFVRINIYEEQLSQLYSGVAGKGTRAVFIINDEGEVISSSDKNMLGTSIAEESYLRSILENNDGYILQGNDIICYYRFKTVNWHMVKIDNVSSITSRNIYNFIIMFSIFFILLFAVLFYFLQRQYIIKPVIEIKKDISKIHDGQYNFDLHTKSNDEIADLNKGLIEMGNYIQDLIEKEYKHAISEKDAQLQYLQSQINPHFLYNTLDSVRWLALRDKNVKLAKLITALSNHFKHALNQGRDMTTVTQEIMHIKDYLTIQKNRFGDDLNVDISVQDDVKDLPVLNLILQPLVENAIIHGLEKKLGNRQLEINVWTQDNHIFYKVVDNGMGVDQESIREKLKTVCETNDALALNNVNKRLKYKYGEDYGIEVYSQIGVGTTVIIRIPVGGE